jgi:hypothetical protein
MEIPSFLKPLEDLAHNIRDRFSGGKKTETVEEEPVETPPPVTPDKEPLEDVELSADPVLLSTEDFLKKSLPDALVSLSVEKVSDLENKAEQLHRQTKSEAEKTKAINALSTAIMSDVNACKNGDIDCQAKEIRTLIQTLRKQGIQVPVPENKIKKEDIRGIVDQLNQRWQECKDASQELAQEFQECTRKRDVLYQFIMSALQKVQQTVSKIISNSSSSRVG